MWQAGLVDHMKYETGWGHRWQLCQKASVGMTGPKIPVCHADISAANRKVQALTAAGPKDGDRVNNLTVAICWDWSDIEVAFHPSPSCTLCLLHFISHTIWEKRLIMLLSKTNKSGKHEKLGSFLDMWSPVYDNPHSSDSIPSPIDYTDYIMGPPCTLNTFSTSPYYALILFMRL